MATDNTATYGIEVEDGVSGPTEAAASALDKLKSAMDRDTAALAQLQKAMRNLKAGGESTTEQVGKLQATIDATKSRIAKAQAAYLDLGGGVTRTGRSVANFRERMAGLQTQMQQMPGAMGRAVGMWDRFAKTVGGGWVAAGILGTVAALGALGVATVKLSSDLVEYVTATQNARRTEGLRLEGLTRQWSAVAATYGLAKMAGADLQSGIDRIAASTSLSREQVARYGQQLYTMGLRGKAWESALEGMTIKAATQGEAQAGMFASWAAGTALMGGSVERMTARVKDRLGGLARAQLLDANVQTVKLRENFDSMFRKIDVEPLLKAKASLYEMLSQSTASGRYLSDLLGRIVQPMLDAVTAAIPKIKVFFQSLIILALKAEIEWLHMSNAVADAFSAERWGKIWDDWVAPIGKAKDALLALALVATVRAAPQILVALYTMTIKTWGLVAALWETAAAGTAAFVSMARSAILAIPSLWASAAALWANAAAALAVAAPFVLWTAAVFLLIKVLRGLKQIWDEIDFGLFWKQVKADWESFDIASLGVAIIDGIAEGLSNPGKIFDALKGIAGKIVDVFTGDLEISSPSKVFERLGAEIPAGTAVGIERGRGEVADAMALTTPAPVSAGTPAASKSTPSGGGRGVTIMGGIHVHGAGTDTDAKRIALDVKRELEAILENVALTMGAA